MYRTEPLTDDDLEKFSQAVQNKVSRYLNEIK